MHDSTGESKNSGLSLGSSRQEIDMLKHANEIREKLVNERFLRMQAAEANVKKTTSKTHTTVSIRRITNGYLVTIDGTSGPEDRFVPTPADAGNFIAGALAAKEL